MPESINRKIARRYSKAVTLDNFKSDGTLVATARIYDSTVDLPTSGIAVGAQGYVSSNQNLYIRGTGGWYNIATINNTPTINSVQTAAGDSSPFTLATDGATTTVITINATDSEGFPITFSVVTDVGFDSIATVSNDSSIFTITPFSSDSAGTATSGTLTFKASDGVNIASEVATFTLTFTVSNANTTTMLLKAAGNNGVNTTINDQSGSAMSVVGDPTVHGLSPYHPLGYSTEFDGYITVPSHADFAFADGDWTIEFWHYPLTISTSSVIDYRSSSSQAVPLIWLSGSGFYYLYVNGSNRIEGSANSIVPDKWYHVAVSRVSGSTRMFVNGEQVGSTYSDSNTYVQGSTFHIGRRYSNTGSGWFYLDGYLRDLRIIKGGTGLYSTAFAPPSEPLTVIDSNTKLLLFNSPYPKDKSASDRALSFVGDLFTERMGPYDGLGYNPSSHSSSVYFDGDNALENTITALGTNSFTFEGWFMITADGPSNYQMLFDQRSALSTGPHAYYYESDDKMYMAINAVTFVSDATIEQNTWYHWALVRNSNACTFYLNGKAQTSNAGTSISTNFTGTEMNIGRNSSVGSPANGDYWYGYQSDFRISTTARYTSNFTPPTSPLESDGSTELLTCNGTPNVYDAAKGNRVTLGGTAKSSTAQKKNASSSMLFDGNSDYVELVNDHQYAPGTNNFVVEFWMRYTGGSGTRNIIDTRGQASGYAIRLDSSNNLTIYSEPNSATIHTSASSLTQDQWYHVAFVRNNKESYLFIDGAQSGNSAASISSGNPQDFTSKSMVIGAQNDKSQQFFPGYLEDIRIGNNISRYPFIPTAETLTAGSLTKALTCYAASATTAINSSGSVSITAIDGNSSGSIDAVAASDFGPAAGMKSVYLSGDYLYNLDLGAPIGTDDFCIEGWAYRHLSSGTGARAIFQISDDNTDGLTSSGTYLSLGIRNNSFGNEWQANGGTNITDSDTELGRWYHFVMQRNGGNLYVFIDGSLISSASNTTNYSTARYLTIGGYYSTGYLWYGYISNLRVSVGSGSNFYANSFTPPTSELTA